MNNNAILEKKKNRLQKFISDVFIRVFAQIAVSLKGLVFLPLIAKNLGTSEYGIWSQITITSKLFAPVLMLDLSEASVRYLNSEEDEEKRKTFFSMLGIVWIILLLTFILSVPLSNQISLLVFSEKRLVFFVRLLMLYLMTKVTFLFVHSYYRAVNNIKQHSVIQILQTLGEIAVASSLVIFLDFQLTGVLAAVICIEVLVVIGMLFNIVSNIGFSLQFNFVKLFKYLKYSVPLIPTVALYWVINSSDRYIIVHYLSLKEVGVYSAAYRLGQIISFLLSPVAFTLLPLISKLWEQKEFSEVRKYTAHSLKYYLFLAVPGVFGIYQLGPIILKNLANQEFAIDRLLILFIAIGVFFVGLYQIYVYIIYLTEKTRYLPMIFFVVAGLNIVLNFFMVPRMGIMGAAAATFISYFLQFTAVFALSRKLFTIDLDLLFLLKSLLCSGVMFLIIRIFPVQKLLEIIEIGILGISIYIVLMILLKGIGKKEWNLLQSFFCNVPKVKE